MPNKKTSPPLGGREEGEGGLNPVTPTFILPRQGGGGRFLNFHFWKEGFYGKEFFRSHRI